MSRPPLPPIEHHKGKPMPAYRRRGAKSRYRWNEMIIGSAFQFPEHVAYGDARRMAHAAGRTFDMLFAVRVMEDGTCWCWRVPDDYRERRNPNLPVTIELAHNVPYKPQEGDDLVGTGQHHPDMPVEPPEDEI